MVTFDSAAGQTIFDSQLFKEMFQPWNSPVFNDLINDTNNFVLLRIFLYVAIPIFILVMFALENYVRKDYGKDVHLHRVFRIGRRMMLTSGLVIFLRALLGAFELIFSKRYLISIPSGAAIPVNIFYILAMLAIGFFGYKLWKDPTKKNILIAFGMGVALLVLSVTEMVFAGKIIETGDLPRVIDQVIILVITLSYIIGSVIVRANYNLGLLKPRDK